MEVSDEFEDPKDENELDNQNSEVEGSNEKGKEGTEEIKGVRTLSETKSTVEEIKTNIVVCKVQFGNK